MLKGFFILVHIEQITPSFPWFLLQHWSKNPKNPDRVAVMPAGWWREERH
jgi:hypothetical protein